MERVKLAFSDIIVELEDDSGIKIEGLDELALNTLSFLIKERIAYSRIDDGEEADGDVPEAEPLTITGTPAGSIPVPAPTPAEVGRGYA